MQSIRIKDANIQCLEPCNDGQPLAFLCLDASGGDAFDSLRPGVVVYDSRHDLASDADETWKKHHFTFGPSLWTPRHDEKDNEIPVHQDASGLYLQVWRLQVISGHSLGVVDGAHRSELTGYGSLASIIQSLGDGVVESSPVVDDSFAAEEHANWGFPKGMPVNMLGQM